MGPRVGLVLSVSKSSTDCVGAVISSLGVRKTKAFVTILQSKQLDTMLLMAVDYCKWFVHVYLLQKQQEQSSSARLKELPQHLVNIFLPTEVASYSSEALESLTIENSISLEQAR